MIINICDLLRKVYFDSLLFGKILKMTFDINTAHPGIHEEMFGLFLGFLVICSWLFPIFCFFWAQYYKKIKNKVISRTFNRFILLTQILNYITFLLSLLLIVGYIIEGYFKDIGLMIIFLPFNIIVLIGLHYYKKSITVEPVLQSIFENHTE
jgi:hypothetical protein